MHPLMLDAAKIQKIVRYGEVGVLDLNWHIFFENGEIDSVNVENI